MLGQPVSMLIPQVVGFRLHGKLREGVDGDRPRADRHADAAQEGRGRQVRRVLRRRPGRAVARRPRHHRQHGARVRRDLRHLPGRRRDAALPALHRPRGRRRSRWSRPTRASRASSTAPRRRRRSTPTSSSSISRSVEPSLAGPKRPQDRVSLGQDAPVVRGGAAEPGQAQEEGAPAPAAASGNGGSTSVGFAPVGAPRARGQERLGRDRRHHELHQHLEPVGAGRGRPGREEGGRAGALDEAVGQDLARARLEGGHRVPRRGGAHAVPREAPVPPRRLRLHDLHRQLRPAAAADLGGDRGARPGRRAACSPATATSRGAINPEVRANYLASPPLVVAYALAGRIDIDLDKEPLGDGHGRQAGLPARHLADAERGRRRWSARRSSRRCSRSRTATSSRATSAGEASTCRPARPTSGSRASTYVKHPPYFEDMPKTAGRRRRHQGRARARRARRQRHHRPHLARRHHQEGRPGRQVPDRARRRPRRTSTATARAAATTR